MPKTVNKASNVRVIKGRGKVDVSALLRDGVFVDLYIGRWRASQKIQPEDIGLEHVDRETLTKYLTLGKKTLIPPEMQKKLNSVESCARDMKLRYTLDTPFGRFCPMDSFKKLDEEIGKYEAEWFRLRDELCKHMATHLVALEAGYKELASEVYAQLLKKGMTEGKYASMYATRILVGVPSVKTIHESFIFELRLNQPADMTVMDPQIRKKILEEEESLEKLKTIRQKEERRREFNERVQKRQEKDKEEKIDKFLNAINEQVRNSVLVVARAAQTSLSKNNRLIGKTTTQLKGMIERFHMMNVLNDKDLDKEIAKIERLLTREPSSETSIAKRNRELDSALRKLEQEALEVSLDLAIPSEPRAIREEIIADEAISLPSHKRIGREARESLF